MSITCRPYVQNDFPFMRKMLYEAVFWSRSEDLRPSLKEGLSYDYTKHILKGFGTRKGDLAVIADVSGKRAGAVFIRYWTDQLNIRGYISKRIPVLVIGVEKTYRRQGVATKLLNSIKSVAKDNGIFSISLCVSKTNIAYHLYRKNDFEIVEEIESSFNMLWKKTP